MQAEVRLRFRLTPSTELILQHGDITSFCGDAIVNSANEMLCGAGPTSCDGAIHLAAGGALLEAALQVPEVQPGVRCPIGEARMTLAGRLAVRHVIHAVGPVYTYGAASVPLLESTYRSALALANAHKLQAVAFPAISCGTYCFPPNEAAEVALRVCTEEAGGLDEIHFFFLRKREMRAWTRWARATLVEVTDEEEAPMLRQLMRAAQQGRQQEVQRLLRELGALQLGGAAAAAGGLDATNRTASRAGGTEVEEEEVEEVRSSPSSCQPQDRAASSSLDRPQHAVQQPGAPAAGHAAGSQWRWRQPGEGGSSCSGAVDVRRWQFAFDSLQMIKEIGEGSFGKVWMAKHKGTTYAVKMLLKVPAGLTGGSRGSGRGGRGAAHSLMRPELTDFKREAEMLAGLRHPHVVAFFGVCLDPPCIVTEYCAGHSLYCVYKAAQGGDHSAIQQLIWLRRLSLLCGVARGMLALHTHDPPIIHRDLRSLNVFIDQAGVAKVGDFGLSRFADDSGGARSVHSEAGDRNPCWMAPEVASSIMENDGVHPATKASDSFQFGMVMYELLVWRTPWHNKVAAAVFVFVQRGDRPDVPSRDQLPGSDTASFKGLDAYLKLMRECWATNPSERPTFDKIVTTLEELLAAEAKADRARREAAKKLGRAAAVAAGAH